MRKRPGGVNDRIKCWSAREPTPLIFDATFGFFLSLLLFWHIYTESLDAAFAAGALILAFAAHILFRLRRRWRWFRRKERETMSCSRHNPKENCSRCGAAGACPRCCYCTKKREPLERSYANYQGSNKPMVDQPTDQQIDRKLWGVR